MRHFEQLLISDKAKVSDVVKKLDSVTSFLKIEKPNLFVIDDNGIGREASKHHKSNLNAQNSNLIIKSDQAKFLLTVNGEINSNLNRDKLRYLIEKNLKN